jgi:GNAT superfamily N-acetyltransferase
MLMIATFQREAWSKCEAEIQAMVKDHWSEIALDRDRIKLDIDYELYRKADIDGRLFLFTVRERGALIGYYVAFVYPHPHYRSTLFSLMDSYFILPRYRKGPVGIDLFRKMEDAMRTLGVQSMIATTKLHHNVAPIFERLEWRQVGLTFQKYIGQ